MCEGIFSTAKQIGDEKMKCLLRQMCSNGHINSTEVAVLCLLQKKMNDHAWSSEMTVEIHARANRFKSLPQN